MAMGCVFCDKIQRSDGLTHEGEYVVSFVPLNPVANGHRLFVPRRHLQAADSDPMMTGRVFEQAALYASRLPMDYNLITSAGPTSTQSVYHLHVHYVPRAEGDGLSLPWTGQEK